MLRLLRIAGAVLLFTVVLFSCVVWHELLGHALAAVLVGGGVDRLVMFGIELFPSPGWSRVILLAVAWWFLDLLTFTLPSVGLRRGIFFGTTYSEPYEGAVGMGVPGPLFQGAVFAATVLLLAALYVPRRGDKLVRPVAAA